VNKSPCQSLLIFPFCGSRVTTCGAGWWPWVGILSVYVSLFDKVSSPVFPGSRCTVHMYVYISSGAAFYYLSNCFLTHILLKKRYFYIFPQNYPQLQSHSLPKTCPNLPRISPFITKQPESVEARQYPVFLFLNF